MLEPSRHVKAMSNVGVGFPLIEKKINVLFFSFIEEIKFNTWELFNLPRCPARGILFFLKYIESYNNLDIKMKFHYMIRLMAV